MHDNYIVLFTIDNALYSLLQESTPIIILFFIFLVGFPLLLILVKPFLIDRGFILQLVKNKELRDFIIQIRSKLYFISLIIICSSSIGIIPLSFFFYFSFYLEYSKLEVALKNKNYSTIQGYVENLNAYNSYIRTEDYMENAQESFDINGVVFKYSPNVLTISYHKVVDQGGYLNEGKLVRLQYVLDNGQNKIIKIEIPREP